MWKVRVEELLLSDRALLLGHPMHSLSNRIWAKSEVRLARDGKGYTLLEFEAHYGENYEVHWNLGEPCSGGRHELARHGALLRLLKEHRFQPQTHAGIWHILIFRSRPFQFSPSIPFTD